MRTSLDACDPAGMEPGHDLYLGYCDMKCAFRPNPGNYPVRYLISSGATSPCGPVGDVEPGNPYWPAWIAWVLERRAAGEDPTLYCCDDLPYLQGSTFWAGWRHSDGVQYFKNYGVPEPHWWPFNYTTSVIPDYAVALQVGGTAGFDLSLIRGAYWPGVEAPPLEDDVDFTMRDSTSGAVYLVKGGFVAHLPDQASVDAMTALGIPDATAKGLSEAGVQSILAAVPKITGTFTLAGTLSGTGAIT